MVHRRYLMAIPAAILAFTSMATSGDKLDRRVVIANDIGFTIVEFYGSNNGTDSWEEDILGADVLPPNSTVRIDFDDGTGYCMFDFKAVFDDGEV
ncbi:MAG: hypothetical protein ACC646_11635, partial [Paracoccaceae bacterium]